MSINECLRAESEINQAIVELAKRGLRQHPSCHAKSWDLEKAIKFIVEKSKPPHQRFWCGGKGKDEL